jgi:CBS-domain-containing membrane protein
MPNIQITDVDGITAAAVMHPVLTTLTVSACAADVRDYFAASSSRRLATLTDGDRYAGAICADRMAQRDDPPDTPATDLVHPHPTVGPETPAAEARDLALGAPSRRVPVVDGDGRLVGVVAIDKLRVSFCGTGG